MKIFECKCGSTEVFIEQSGNNTGLYCAECGKWITWLNKDQLRLAKRQIDNHDKQIRADAIEQCIDKFAEILSNMHQICGRSCPVNCKQQDAKICAQNG